MLQTDPLANLLSESDPVLNSQCAGGARFCVLLFVNAVGDAFDLELLRFANNAGVARFAVVSALLAFRENVRVFRTYGKANSDLNLAMGATLHERRGLSLPAGGWSLSD